MHFVKITKRHIVFIIIVAIAFWATWPGANSVKLETCDPDSTFSHLSSIIYRANFWQTQLEHVRQDIVQNEKRKANYERIRAAPQIERQRLEEIYQKYPKMAPSLSEREPDKLRARADEIESAEGFRVILEVNQKVLSMLQHCEAEIRSKLR
jgi:hypothetical protein